ncbi:ExbD/TolR family protein [Zavarzinella formosa]|uniref:ExbD/TolR family protein n=1 Tax=Zavarzinella formosa TaxID=360055 RepID=UPI000302A6C9|nr:biopolymer transporter ExbD [Zavarzinella formosa]
MSHKKKKEPPIDITLPITPMLDMSFQLLSFFMLTFKPMPTEGQMSINLPKPDAAETPTDKVDIPSDDKKDEYTITVFSSQGDIGLISFKGPVSAPAELVGENKLAALLKALKDIPKPAGKGPEAISVTIEASPDLSYARLIEVMDVCKRAGYESVGLTPIKKEKN